MSERKPAVGVMSWLDDYLVCFIDVDGVLDGGDVLGRFSTAERAKEYAAWLNSAPSPTSPVIPTAMEPDAPEAKRPDPEPGESFEDYRRRMRALGFRSVYETHDVWVTAQFGSPTPGRGPVVPRYMEPLLGSLAELAHAWEIDKDLKDYTTTFHRAMAGVLGHLAELPTGEPLAGVRIGGERVPGAEMTGVTIRDSGPFSVIDDLGVSSVVYKEPGSANGRIVSSHYGEGHRELAAALAEGENAEHRADPSSTAEAVRKLLERSAAKPDPTVLGQFPPSNFEFSRKRGAPPKRGDETEDKFAERLFAEGWGFNIGRYEWIPPKPAPAS